MCTLTTFSLKWLSETQKRQFIQKNLCSKYYCLEKNLSLCSCSTQLRCNRTLMKDFKLCSCLWQQSSVQPVRVRLSLGLAGSVAEEDTGGQRKPSLSEAGLPEGDPHPGRGHPRLHMWRWASHGSYPAKCCKGSHKKKKKSPYSGFYAGLLAASSNSGINL